MSANDRLQFLGLLLHLFVLFSSYRLVVYHFDSKWDDIFCLQAYIIFYLTLLKFVSLLCRKPGQKWEVSATDQGRLEKTVHDATQTNHDATQTNHDAKLFSFHYRHIDADSINMEVGEDSFFT
jgi:hypothetical protein